MPLKSFADIQAEADRQARADAIARHRKEKGLDPEGQPVFDPTPMAPPIGYKKQPSIFDQVRDAMKAHQLEELEQLQESLDDAEDYEIDDDPPDPASKWEMGSQYSLSELKQMVREKREELEEWHRQANRLPSDGPQGPRPQGGDDQGVRGAAPAEKPSVRGSDSD